MCMYITDRYVISRCTIYRSIPNRGIRVGAPHLLPLRSRCFRPREMDSSRESLCSIFCRVLYTLDALSHPYQSPSTRHFSLYINTFIDKDIYVSIDR